MKSIPCQVHILKADILLDKCTRKRESVLLGYDICDNYEISTNWRQLPMTKVTKNSLESFISHVRCMIVCVIKPHFRHTLSPSQSATAPLRLKWFQLMSNLSRLSLEA